MAFHSRHIYYLVSQYPAVVSAPGTPAAWVRPPLTVRPLPQSSSGSRFKSGFESSSVSRSGFDSGFSRAGLDSESSRPFDSRPSLESSLQRLDIDSTPAQKPGEKRVLKPYGKTLSGSSTRSRSATKELEIPPDDSLMYAPVFDDKMPAALTVRDGGTLSLHCQVRGDPDPKIAWSKNGEPLSSSDAVDLKYRNGVATLAVAEVFPEDEGLYECRAYNSMGDVTAKCKVTVTGNERRCMGQGESRVHVS